MSKLYQVRHVTRYRYEQEISENVMEVRKCPLSRDNQRCMSFSIKVKPRAKLSKYEDYLGTIIHNFDIPQPHDEMTVTAESVVEVKIPEELPSSVSYSVWAELLNLQNQTEYLDFVLFSPMVESSDGLRSLYAEMKPEDSEDPLTYLRRINQQLTKKLTYQPQHTQVDSSIDFVLECGRGVCQDFAHLMIGLARSAGIPCRYVSGYLYHDTANADRSSGDATHAWVEAYLPELGWIGFDPANGIIAAERHIVTAVGRDYKDVPPTRGVYRGYSASELSVAVQVHPADTMHSDDTFQRMPESEFRSEPEEPELSQQQQQQQ